MNVFTAIVGVLTDMGEGVLMEEKSLVKVRADDITDAIDIIEELLDRDKVNVASNKPYSDIYFTLDLKVETPTLDTPRYSEQFLNTTFSEVLGVS